MHDCSTMERKLVDLIFDELGVKERQRLLAEIDNCAACLREYRSMTKTMLIFDQAVEVSLPDESYWPAHHEALRQRLETLALPAKAECEPFWKRILLAKLPVPVPVAAVIVLGLLVGVGASPFDASGHPCCFAILIYDLIAAKSYRSPCHS